MMSVKSTRGFINVKEAGAIGDGVTDDTATIQKVIDQACYNWGSTLFFPSGNYLIKNTLVVKAFRKADVLPFGEPSDVHFTPHVECIIMGSGTATITAGAKMDYILLLQDNTNIGSIGPFYTQVYNLRFDGKSLAKTGVAWRETMHTTVAKNIIVNCEIGFMNDEGYSVERIRDNLIIADICIDFHSAGGDASIECNNLIVAHRNGIGINIRKYGGNVVIENNSFVGDGCLGVRFDTTDPIVDEVRDVRVRNNTFKGMSCAVHTDGSSPGDVPIVFSILVSTNIIEPSPTSDNSYTGQLVSFRKVANATIVNNCINTILANTNKETACIKLIECHGPLVAYNCFSNLYSSAIYVESTNYGIFTGNSIQNGGVNNKNSKIIEIAAGSNYNQVKSNTILQSDSLYAQCGIFNDSRNIGNILENNIFEFLQK